ncbi:MULTISPECIES: hypothetical protein [unclassified Planococcus (in: firmicutes)]|nr:MULTISPECIES: hypothetical protein [unclassified Planococcus (in: firmicutes)]
MAFEVFEEKGLIAALLEYIQEEASLVQMGQAFLDGKSIQEIRLG